MIPILEIFRTIAYFNKNKKNKKWLIPGKQNSIHFSKHGNMYVFIDIYLMYYNNIM